MEEVPALAKYVRRYDYVVAKDGSGDFFTVQEAESITQALRDEALQKEKQSEMLDKAISDPA